MKLADLDNILSKTDALRAWIMSSPSDVAHQIRALVDFMWSYDPSTQSLDHSTELRRQLLRLLDTARAEMLAEEDDQSEARPPSEKQRNYGDMSPHDAEDVWSKEHICLTCEHSGICTLEPEKEHLVVISRCGRYYAASRDRDDVNEDAPF